MASRCGDSFLISCVPRAETTKSGLRDDYELALRELTSGRGTA